MNSNDSRVEGRDDSALVRLRERREQIRSTAPRAEAAYFDVSLIDRVLDVLAAVAQTPATPLEVQIRNLARDRAQEFYNAYQGDYASIVIGFADQLIAALVLRPPQPKEK